MEGIIGLDDDSMWIYIKDTSGNYSKENIASDIYFHPKFGLCLILDTIALNDFLWLEIYLFNDFFDSTLIFLHEKEELPDFSHSHITHKKEEYIRVDIEKEVEIQSYLNRRPCSKNRYHTCQDILFRHG